MNKIEQKEELTECTSVVEILTISPVNDILNKASSHLNYLQFLSYFIKRHGSLSIKDLLISY